MAGKRATLYDFRDLDLMYRIAEETEQGGIGAAELGELLGFDADDGARALGRRLAWMRRYGMVSYDDRDHIWKLSPGGVRVTEAHLRAAQSRTIEALPDESMVEVMAHVTARYRHGDAMTAHLLRREFAYGTAPRKRF